MKKLFVILIILLSIDLSFAAFCCKDPNTCEDINNLDTCQDKCYNTGACCNGLWYSSCYDFDIWVVGPSVFRIGRQTPVVIYIKNKGAYTDSFSITAEPSDSRILVEMSGADSATILAGEIKRLYPRITILTSLTGEVTFRATSPHATKEATLKITESDLYLSLPDFQGFTPIILLFLVGFIYFTTRQKYF
ncbi:MAG: hypothetical protein QXY45_01420 [Candidatus Aenigmatarchaeota archaeon]